MWSKAAERSVAAIRRCEPGRWGEKNVFFFETWLLLAAGTWLEGEIIGGGTVVGLFSSQDVDLT